MLQEELTEEESMSASSSKVSSEVGQVLDPAEDSIAGVPARHVYFWPTRLSGIARLHCSAEV